MGYLTRRLLKSIMKKINNIKMLQGFLIIISIAFIAFGIYSEEMYMVLQKSIKLCLECVGIG